MRFGILGPLEVASLTGPVRVGGSQLRVLLAALLVRANETVSADALGDILWPEALPDRPLNALQSQVSRLRSLLDAGDPAGSPTSASRRPSSQGSGYVLRIEPDELDAFAFEALAARVDVAIADREWQLGLKLADDALDLWRGQAFEEFASLEWARARTEQLDERRLVTVERRVEAKLAMGQHRQLTGELRDLVTRYPLREPFWIHLMLALYRSGRQSEALRAYAEVRAILAEELGILPCAELSRLEQQVLDQDDALDLDLPSATLATTTTTPTRVVSFLFTEVDAGTARWDLDEAGMGAALRSHEDQLRTAVESRAGQVFGQVGDGFCVAFERPADALGAAIEGQRRLQAAAQGEREPLRARMAIHTGDAELREDTYFGPAVNRAARLREASHGGQILVSAASYELVQGALPEDAGLADVGRWLLEGFSRPERVYQLTHPDLPNGFPPLRSARPHTGALPRHSTSFLGREEEVERTVAALRESQLVTLTGEGGIGKTRLVLELAHRALPADYPDGVWFCDISSVDDAAGLAEHLAAGLQLTLPIGDGNAHRELLSSLERAQLLLVIDNCERLRAAVAGLVGEILAASASVTILTTSRAPLRARGEQVVKLEPLALPDVDDASPSEAPAVQLLIERARAAGAPVEEGESALADIARSLDGLPLAIELAAPRLAAMSPRELATRLGTSSDLLQGTSDLPARQRTLRATIDGSFQLLDDQARTVFGSLSVFRGGWTLATAEAVAAAAGIEPEQVAPLLSGLVDHSMIRVDLAAGRTARYSMLDSVQSYAADYLAATGRGPDVAARHASHFIELAETAAQHRRGPLEPAWVEELETEFDNLRAAYRWSVRAGRVVDATRLVAALTDDLLMRERLGIGRWAGELAALPGLAGNPRQPLMLALAGNTAMVEGRFDEALRLSRAALTAEEETGGPRTWIARNTMALLIVAGRAEGDWYELLRAMEDIGRDSDDPLPAAVADYDRVLIASLAGLPGAGLPAAEALLARNAEVGNPSLLAMALLSHGRALAGSDPDAAIKRYREALAAASAAHNTLLVQQALRSMGEVEARGNDRATALASLRRIAARFESSGNVAEQLQTVLSMLDSLVAMGALAEATTICAALARTPLQRTATWRMVSHTVSEKLERERHLAAYRAGASMTPADLATFVSTLVEQLEAGP